MGLMDLVGDVARSGALRDFADRFQQGQREDNFDEGEAHDRFDEVARGGSSRGFGGNKLAKLALGGIAAIAAKRFLR